LTYRRSAGWLGGDARFQEAGLDVLAAMPFGRHAVQGSLAYHATLSGELPLHLRHRLGGRGRLAGFHYNELAGEHYAVLMAGYSYQLASFFRRSAVAGATLEYGNAWERRGDMRLGDGIWNGSLYLGFDSAMGPMLFGYGRREGGEAVLFLEIGKPFYRRLRRQRRAAGAARRRRLARVNNPDDVLILGGGAIGLATALSLLEAGRGVRVLEAGRVGGATWHGNCGTVTPSHAPPLAAPGV